MSKYCDICFEEITKEQVSDKKIEKVTNIEGEVVIVHKKCFSELPDNNTDERK